FCAIEGSPAVHAIRTCCFVLFLTSSGFGRWRWFLGGDFPAKTTDAPWAMEAHLVAVASNSNISLIIDRLVNEGLDVQLVS
ncbi:hypothetical protein OFL98_29275, partial [Escherichia coli]|nr:hypothetical protein [Escherichia coli]